ncbi:hypothetical protein JCGZ_13737 [Jatropha curcas]|uniref:UBX domain-containing protein n=1 Tax=Jatropha curcas TaxID=180498 RepID=A0A067KG40_JATCU|nr:plant UBX domain-containing protein 4 [Jatropha curcas]KDP30794.1 hypothetical protein JCGZ_13737 [Jatropha curcas]
MDNTTEAKYDLSETDAVRNTAMINSFCEITSSSKEEALFFLESHQFNLDSAVSTFLDNYGGNNHLDPSLTSLPIAPPNRAGNSSSPSTPSESQSPNYSPSQSPSRSRSRSPSPAPSRAPYRLRSSGKKPARAATGGESRKSVGIRTLSDLNREPEAGSGSDDDDDDYEPQQYYTGGEKSGMLVQDPTKHYDADAVFNQARNLGVERPVDHLRSSSSSISFTGTGRLLSGETVPSAPQPPEPVHHTITLWRNGFTVDDGPLRRFDDPANASFLESIKKSECPLELEPADRRTQVHLDLIRREENYSEPERRQTPFQGVGRTIGSSSGTTAPTSPTSLKAAPLPAIGLVVDSSSPTTSIQLRLADGTRMVSRFNLHHTIRDIRAFIEASRPVGGRNYQLLTMGFPPKQLTDPEQTIEEAGIASSVVIQKF